MKPELEFNDSELIPWEPVAGAPGQFQKILSRDPETGSYTRLLKCAPNLDTSMQGVQVHDCWEEVFIIHGSLTDLRLNQSFSAGYYACRPPGMSHGPWKIGPQGSVNFEIRTYARDAGVR